MDSAFNPEYEDYKVDLAVFHGPLDLLLHLIKKEEVDIYDIPIAKITKQYLTYIDMMTNLSLEIAGEFVLMAATLIRIKTRLLLPRDPSDPEEADPREELIMALMEYRKYREASEVLRDKALLEEQTCVPPNPVGQIQGRIDFEPATGLYDLLAAFQDVLKTKPKVTVHNVENEEIAIEDRIRAVMSYLEGRDFATFEELFADVPVKIAAVVTFIALLELARAHRIAIHQTQPFSRMRVYRGEMFDAPRLEVDLVDVTAMGKKVE